MQIYLIVNRMNGKTYVGKTVSQNLYDYLSVKRWQVRHGRISGMPIIAAIRKYGWENFDVQTVAICETEAELNNLERLWIAILDSTRMDTISVVAEVARQDIRVQRRPAEKSVPPIKDENL